jgi:hypothetical protein
VNGRIFAVKTIREWIHSTWKDELGYLPELVELNRNWYAFTFQNSEHSKWVLSKAWSINNSPLLLKPWNPLFDASTERLDKILVWVRLPALPFHLWSFDYFKKIGNFLGDFLDADMTFEETKQRKVARILVNLNVREGLGEEMDLSWGGYTYAQKLDYENIPFRCRRCHQYGHLVKNCKLPLRTRGTVYGRYKDSQKLVGSSESALFTQKEQGSQTEDMSVDFVQPSSELATLRPDQQTPVLEGATSFPVTGTSSNPGPSIIVLINNLSIKSPEWLLSPSLPPLPPLITVLPSFPPPSLPPPMSALSPASSSSLLPLESPTSLSAPALEDSTTSSSDTSSRRYFLRSLNREHSGGLALDPTPTEKSGRGRKSLISKAQKKARIDLLAGKQVSIERALRARRTLGKGP